MNKYDVRAFLDYLIIASVATVNIFVSYLPKMMDLYLWDDSEFDLVYGNAATIVPFLLLLPLLGIYWRSKPENDSARTFLQSSGLPVPKKLRIISLPINAFAERSTFFTRAIAVPKNFQTPSKAKENLVKARFAHELGHIRNSDLFSIQLYVIVLAQTLFIYVFRFWTESYDLIRETQQYSYFLFLYHGLPAICLIRIFFLVRNREFRADQYAYKLMGEDYLRYLKLNARIYSYQRPISLRARLMQRFTHPPFELRLKRLTDTKAYLHEYLAHGIFFGLSSIVLLVAMINIHVVVDQDLNHFSEAVVAEAAHSLQASIMWLLFGLDRGTTVVISIIALVLALIFLVLVLTSVFRYRKPSLLLAFVVGGSLSAPLYAQGLYDQRLDEEEQYHQAIDRRETPQPNNLVPLTRQAQDDQKHLIQSKQESPIVHQKEYNLDMEKRDAKCILGFSVDDFYIEFLPNSTSLVPGDQERIEWYVSGKVNSETDKWTGIPGLKGGPKNIGIHVITKEYKSLFRPPYSLSERRLQEIQAIVENAVGLNVEVGAEMAILDREILKRTGRTTIIDEMPFSACVR